MKEQPKLRAITQGGCYGCWYNAPGVVCPRAENPIYLKCVDNTAWDDFCIFIPINHLFPVNTYER